MKKTIKKKFALVITMVMVFTCMLSVMSMTVAASDIQIQFVIDTVQIDAGQDRVEVDISVSGVPADGISSYTLFVRFPSEHLEFSHAVNGPIIPPPPDAMKLVARPIAGRMDDYQNTISMGLITGSAPLTDNGVLSTLVFDVRDPSEDATYLLELFILDLYGNCFFSSLVDQSTWLGGGIIVGEGGPPIAPLEFIPPRQPGTGDVNIDGEVDIGDVNRLYLDARGRISLAPEELIAADVNGDGTIDIGDVNMLYLYVRGRISSLGR